MEKTGETNQNATAGQSSPRIKELLKNLARYMRDFLDTDFKKGYAPKRRIGHKDRNGQLITVAVRRYPGLVKDIWALLRKPVGDGLTLNITRGRYRSELDKSLADYIDQAIDAIQPGQVDDLVQDVRRIGREVVKQHYQDPERIKVTSLNLIEREVIKKIVVPLVLRLEPQLDAAAKRGIEVSYDIEDELGDMLVASNDEVISSSLNHALVAKSFDRFDSLIDSLLSLKTIQVVLRDHFDSFKVTDVFSELLELRQAMRVKENTELYVYVGDINAEKFVFPAFYLSFEMVHADNSLTLSFNPHLYVNKRGIDFLAHEIAKAERSAPPIMVKDRIVYLTAEQRPIDAIQHHIDHWVGSLAMRPAIDCASDQGQIARSSLGAISNRLYFAVSDKADEAMVNDYEQMLTLAESGSPVFADFAELVQMFLEKEPVSVRPLVDKDWDQTSIEDRLVYESPIPLNEEQRKIARALRDPSVRFVSVMGPPGTGKSHTITSMAFDAILRGQSVLVLSDKKEALDVVQNKLTETLDSVRLESDFQNPILRLGSISTYNKILSAQSIVRLTRHHRSAVAHKAELDEQLAKSKTQLQGELRDTVRAVEAIDLRLISEFQQLEASLHPHFEKLLPLIRTQPVGAILDDLNAILAALHRNGGSLRNLLEAGDRTPSFSQLAQIISLSEIVQELRSIASGQHQLLASLFRTVREKDVDVIRQFVVACRALRWPIFGFYFVRRKAETLDIALAKSASLVNPNQIHTRWVELEKACYLLANVRNRLQKSSELTGGLPIAFALVCHPDYDVSTDSLRTLAETISKVRRNLANCPDLAEALDTTDGNLDRLFFSAEQRHADAFEKLLSYRRKFRQLSDRFASVPEFDYVGEKAKVESLCTRRLAFTIDERVVEFHQNHRAMASALKSIIKNRERFPTDKFEVLRHAFPCIIAGIREYAEFVPLERDLFDLVIIDEASQVSLAQGFPAMLRAKKLVVLGDRNQFSNVKTSQASLEINAQYLSEMRRDFEKHGPVDSVTFNRLKKFDIKTSVLDFVDMIANYGTMLTKHFRSYPELISFSSKYFYGNGLQAVKIRGKPIDDVIEFSVLTDDGKQSLRGNSNELEANFIEEKLIELLEDETPPTVGIITPFTDQQAYLTRRLGQHAKGSEFIDRLRLKIMTFDSCQGEERQIIFYSLVANAGKDRLWGVFPRAIADAGDIENVLRLQRLNVGFSRAQEKIHFVLSKSVDQFENSVREALNHYTDVLIKARAMPGFEATDRNSPKEKQVLTWIFATEFYQRYGGEVIEVIPQYPIGEYLRQLDPYYQHPAYRVDFLIRLHTDHKSYSIILEYDGFQEHFSSLEEVNSTNWRSYLKPEDVEREKVLESYGYRTLRINRFNVGDDPVATLSARLTKLVESLVTPDMHHHLINKMNETTQALESGEMKQCKSCKQIRPIAEFRDASLKRGISQSCMKCRRSRSTRGRRWR